MKKIIGLMILSVSFIITSCQLPPSPNEPFYCKINGKIFRPEKDSSPFGGVGVSPLKIELDKKYNWIYISATRNQDYVSLKIKLDANNSIEKGEYILKEDLTDTHITYSTNIKQSNSDYLQSNSGKLIITQVKNSQIWGTFEFKTKNKAGTEFLITNGQFNALRY
jgi:hypothetical protein